MVYGWVKCFGFRRLVVIEVAHGIKIATGICFSP